MRKEEFEYVGVSPYELKFRFGVLQKRKPVRQKVRETVSFSPSFPPL